MAFLIQQTPNYINVIDLALTNTDENIVQVLPLDSIARPIPRDANGIDEVSILNTNGKPGYTFYLDGTLQYQDNGGVPTVWSGTLDDFVEKLNGSYFVAPSGGTGGSTSANQDILNEQTQAKHIGYILDLPNDDGGFGVQFPFQYVELQINIDGVAKSFAGANQSLVDTTELAKALNNSQSLVYFGALNNTQLYFMPVFDTVVQINSIGIYEGNSGSLLEYNSFPKTSNLPTGAVHQLVTLIEQQQQILKGIKEPLETTFSLSYSGNPVRNITQDTDEDGKLAPANRVADIIVCAINNNVYFAFNSETTLNSPTNKYPKIRNREMYLKNVDLNTFRIGGSAGASRYSLIINLKK